MLAEDPDIAVQRLGDDHAGGAGPDLAVRHDQRYPQAHWRSSSFAFFSTSSTPPTMKNACSGKLSYLPSVSALNEAMVSSSETKTPGCPVNCSATNIGWDRNRSMRRARLTVTWSSSDSSSMPSRAMMSC